VFKFFTFENSKVFLTLRLGETALHRVLISNFTFSVKLKLSVTPCLNSSLLRFSFLFQSINYLLNIANRFSVWTNDYLYHFSFFPFLLWWPFRSNQNWAYPTTWVSSIVLKKNSGTGPEAILYIYIFILLQKRGLIAGYLIILLVNSVMILWHQLNCQPPVRNK